jgi:hypothetical protein
MVVTYCDNFDNSETGLNWARPGTCGLSAALAVCPSTRRSETEALTLPKEGEWKDRKGDAKRKHGGLLSMATCVLSIIFRDDMSDTTDWYKNVSKKQFEPLQVPVWPLGKVLQ